MNKYFFILVLCLFGQQLITAQTTTLQGYVFESGNRGFLNLVKVTVYNNENNAIVAKTDSDIEGVFKVELPTGGTYRVKAEKGLFENKEEMVSTVGIQSGDKVFVKMKMQRKPGYLFDVTMAEKRMDEDMVVDAIQGARIEAYNRTEKKEVLNLINHPNPTFKLTFENGNHYTILLRKEGYFNKRMEAYVNVKGCILCFDGVGDVRPGVSDVLTEGHSMGTLLANVELEKIEVNKSIVVENIYYDLGSAKIREDAAKELDKVVALLKDNPRIVLELGSHTDSRGKDEFNMKLSQRRAKSAVEYIVSKGVDASQITAKGYGETNLVNKCKNGVDCSERRHQKNRRTEIKVLGFQADPNADKSLAEIIEAEEFEAMLAEIENQEIIKVPEDGELPEEIKKQIEEQENKTKQEEEVAEVKKEEVLPETKEVKKEKSDIIKETETIVATTTPESNDKTTEATVQLSEPVEVPKEEVIEKVKRPVAGSTNYRSTNDEQSTTTITEMESSQPTVEKSEPVGTRTQLDASDLEAESFDENDTDQSFGTSKVDTEEVVSGVVKEEALPINQIIKKANLIEKDFTGYLIEFYKSPYQLPSSHEIFSKHGNIIMDEQSNGSYSYMMGSFSNWRDANKFLNSIILARYPDARVVRYKNGDRLRG